MKKVVLSKWEQSTVFYSASKRIINCRIKLLRNQYLNYRWRPAAGNDKLIRKEIFTPNLKFNHFRSCYLFILVKVQTYTYLLISICVTRMLSNNFNYRKISFEIFMYFYFPAICTVIPFLFQTNSFQKTYSPF